VVSEFKTSSVLPMLEAVPNDKELPYLTNNLVFRPVLGFGFIDTTVIHHSLFHVPKGGNLLVSPP
jgi:hypothetical protein